MRSILAAMAVLLAGAAAAQEVKHRVVDAADLGVGSRKHLDTDIEVRGLQCYHADAFDYRCTSGAGVAIFATAVGPQGAREWLERECGQLKVAVSSPKCRATLRFSFSADRIDSDLIDGWKRRVVIRPISVLAVVPQPKR